MMNAILQPAYLSGLVNSTNFTELINQEHNKKCRLQLSDVENQMQTSIPKAILWMTILLVSGSLNLSTMRKILKKEKFCLHSVLLVNLFFADLSAGSFIYILIAMNNLDMYDCFTTNGAHIATLVFKNVSLLSIAVVALNQAKLVKNYNKFLTNQQNEEKKKMSFIVAFIWLYSVTLGPSVTLLMPMSKIWFAQIALLVIFILILQSYCIRKLGKIAKLAPVSNNSMMIKRIQMSRKAIRILLVLLMTELFTWAPLIISISLKQTKIIPIETMSKVLVWCFNILLLAPLLNPIVFYWVSKMKIQRTTNQGTNGVVPTDQCTMHQIVCKQ